MSAIHAVETCQDEITLLLCEHCFEIVLEDDAEFYNELPYCHHCIKEIMP